MLKTSFKSFLATALVICSTNILASNEVELSFMKSDVERTTQNSYKAVIHVKNIAYEKDVHLVYRNQLNEWKTSPAQYQRSSSSDQDIFNFSFLDSSEKILEFAIAYTVAGSTYWDNNNGANYHLHESINDAIANEIIAGPSGQVWPDENGIPHLEGEILVKDASYNKSIKVLYTDDDWATEQYVFANYSETLPSGTQVWKYDAVLREDYTNADGDTESYFAFQYKDEHIEYWNNFYEINYFIRFGNLFPY